MWGQYTSVDTYRTSVMVCGGPYHAVSCQPIAAEDRVQFQASLCEIHGGHSGPGIGFLLRERQFFPVSLIPSMLHTHALVSNGITAIISATDSFIK